MRPRSSGLLNTLRAGPLLCIITTDAITILLPTYTIGTEETCTVQRSVQGCTRYYILL